jgi:hypothetical protein
MDHQWPSPIADYGKICRRVEIGVERLSSGSEAILQLSVLLLALARDFSLPE